MFDTKNELSLPTMSVRKGPGLFFILYRADKDFANVTADELALAAKWAAERS